MCAFNAALRYRTEQRVEQALNEIEIQQYHTQRDVDLYQRKSLI